MYIVVSIAKPRRWTKDGEKMSKSLGNVIDPVQLIEQYGADPVRYFMVRSPP